MSERAFVVELVGLPGVGKTTLVAETLRQLRAERVSARAGTHRADTRLRKAAAVAALSAQRPGYVMVSTRAVTASRQRTAYDYAKVLHNWLNVTAQVDRARREAAVTLFDQGPYQALWTIGYSAGALDLDSFAARLGQRMPSPDLLVLVEADADTVLARLAARGTRASRLDPARSGLKLATDLAGPQLLLDQVAALAARATPLLRLDSGDADSLKANAVRLVASIRDGCTRL